MIAASVKLSLVEKLQSSFQVSFLVCLWLIFSVVANAIPPFFLASHNHQSENFNE